MKLMGFMILSLALLLGLFCPLFAITGDEVIAKVEDSLTGPKDTESKSEMRLANSDGSSKEKRVMKMWMAGKDKRVIKFMEPAGIEGISLLVIGDDEMYLYLPALNKIRRIEGGSKNEDFQGTDFSYNEMGSYEYKKDYSTQLKAEDAASYTLELTRNPGSDRKYSKMIMTVDKSNFVPKKIELYDGANLNKVMTISVVKQEGKYQFPTEIRMENLVKKHYTEISISDTKFDQGLEAKEVFNKRFLKKKAK
jgi:outer membrane lipoprotein-sorting protein